MACACPCTNASIISFTIQLFLDITEDPVSTAHFMLFSCASGRVFAASRTGVRTTSCWPTPRCKRPGPHRPRVSHKLQARIPLDSLCVRVFVHIPRDVMEGYPHQPDDVLHGGFAPDLPCYPPLTHKSSRFEVDDRTPGIPSSPQMGTPHCSG